jgi:hypothetical protein
MKRLLRRPSPASVIALIALGVALGGAAYATIPDSNGTIHACYSKANGNARLVESTGQCRSNEQSASWSSGGGGNTRFLTGQDGPKPYGEPVTLVEVPGLFSIQTTCEEEPDERPGEDLKRITLVLENLQASGDLRWMTPFFGVRRTTLSPGESVTDSFPFFGPGTIHQLDVVDFVAFGGAGKAAQGRVFMTLTNDSCSGDSQALTNF